MVKKRSATGTASRTASPAGSRSTKRSSEKATRAVAIAARLDRHIPEPRCELDYGTPFQLLVAVILSAQCTDKRVNMVTPHLFARYPDAAVMANAGQADIEAIIHSTGFFRNKAKNILAAARRIVEVHGGEIPSTMDELLELPGVARKTANVVLGECFGIADGVVVDTHVTRLSNLLGLTKHDAAPKIEKDLMALLPRENWIRFSHQLILHGRATCIARRPRCSACFLADLCPESGT